MWSIAPDWEQPVKLDLTSSQFLVPTSPVAVENHSMVGEYTEIDIGKWGDKFEAGRVTACGAEWAKIKSDPYILRNIRGFQLEFTETPKQERPPPEIFGTRKVFCQGRDRNFAWKRSLSEGKTRDRRVCIQYFLREKREKGKYRMILNLKHLNKFVEKQHFKMDTLQTTLALVTPECTFMSFDFSDAYYSCSVFYPHRKYLRFTFEGQLYEFTCVPNGLTLAPRFFTKIMKVALTYLRQAQGLQCQGIWMTIF